MSLIDIVLVNTTGEDLYVSGSRGTDFVDLTIGGRVAKGVGTKICQWDPGDMYVNHWDWIFLGYDQNDLRYQLYMQKTDTGKFYRFMGYYVENSDRDNGNPHPFRSGACYLTGWNDAGQWVYVFVGQPD